MSGFCVVPPFFEVSYEDYCSWPFSWLSAFATTDSTIPYLVSVASLGNDLAEFVRHFPILLMKALPVDLVQFKALQDPYVRHWVKGFVVVYSCSVQVGQSGLTVSSDCPVYTCTVLTLCLIITRQKIRLDTTSSFWNLYMLNSNISKTRQFTCLKWIEPGLFCS